MLKKLVKSTIYVIGILLIYEMASIIVNNSLFLPHLVDVWKELISLFEKNTFFNHLGTSFLRVTAGVFFAAAVSVPLGMAIAWCKPVATIFKPMVDSLRNIPPTCFSPILILLLGIGESMKITYIAIAVTFALLPTVIQTCLEPHDDLKETALTMGYSPYRTLLHCSIPYITPSIVKSIVLSYSVGWTYVILAELTNAPYGLGHLMHSGSSRGHMALVFAAMITIIVVGIVFDRCANKIVERVFAWRYKNNEENT